MYAEEREQETHSEKENEGRQEKKKKCNPYKESNTKQWPLYKPIPNLKKTLNVLWRKQQAGNIRM